MRKDGTQKGKKHIQHTTFITTVHRQRVNPLDQFLYVGSIVMNASSLQFYLIDIFWSLQTWVSEMVTRSLGVYISLQMLYTIQYVCCYNMSYYYYYYYYLYLT